MGKQSSFQAGLNFLSKENAIQQMNSLFIGLLQVMKLQQEP